MTPEELKRYTEQLLASNPSLTPEQKESILAALVTPETAKAADAVFVPRSTFNSALDRQKAGYEAWRNEQQQRINEWERSHGGDPNAARPTADPNIVQTQAGNFITRDALEALKREWKEELDSSLASQSGAVLGVLQHGLTMADDYRSRFGKRLNFEEVKELALKEGLPINIAYDRYVQPEVDKLREADLERRIKEAEDRGRMEERTRLENPAASSGIIEGHPVFGRSSGSITGSGDGATKLTPEQAEAESLKRFTDSWNQTNGFTNKATQVR